MSSSRSRSGNSVSLFPFLAVLVCAMGSLIFLLIVTTQRIRSEAVAKRQAQKARQEDRGPLMVKPVLPVRISPAVIEPEPVLAKADLPSPPIGIAEIPGLVDLGISQSTPVLPPPPVIPPQPEPKPIWPAAIAEKPAPVDPNLKLRGQYAQLQALHQARLEASRKKEQKLAKLKQQVELLTQNLRKINSQIEAVAKERAAENAAGRELLKSQNEIFGQLAKVQNDIEDAKNRVAACRRSFRWSHSMG